MNFENNTQPLSQYFIDSVRKMRRAQKDYFKTRSQAALMESKSLEGTVDRILLTLPDPDPKEQPKLF